MGHPCWRKLTDPAAAYVRKQPTERLRQLTQDFLTGQRFRRDVFVRGHPHLPRPQRSPARRLRPATASGASCSRP